MNCSKILCLQGVGNKYTGNSSKQLEETRLLGETEDFYSTFTYLKQHIL
jgi:hypothetical protein